MLIGAIIVITALGALNGWMYLQQPRMVFFPSSDLAATPDDWGMAYEDVSLETVDGLRLHGWYIPRSGAKRVLIFFHGNAGNVSHRGDSLRIFHRLGLNILIIDYRGYGLSEGHPSEHGLYEDARTAWRYLCEERNFEAADIVVFGRSLGGAVAGRLAAEVRPGGVILESTFSSARDMGEVVLPVVSRVLVPRFRFDTARAVAGLRSPVLVLHSPEDEIIPYRQGRKVYEAAPDPKHFVELRGGHNTGFLDSGLRYPRALAHFLAEL